jgi:hypothetical protein
LKNENKILQNQCIETKKSVEQDSSEIKNLNSKVAEVLVMFTTKCAKWIGLSMAFKRNIKVFLPTDSKCLKKRSKNKGCNSRRKS